MKKSWMGWRQDEVTEGPPQKGGPTTAKAAERTGSGTGGKRIVDQIVLSYSM